jgi:hypothetical protein
VALRSDPEFAEVLDEDKEALNIFRKAGDLGDFVEEDDQHSAGSFENETQSEAPESSVQRRTRPSQGSSVTSKRSKASAQSSLPPLYEEDDDDSDEDGEGEPSPPKRLKLNSTDADQSVSTAGHTGTHDESIEEGSADGSDSE